MASPSPWKRCTIFLLKFTTICGWHSVVRWGKCSEAFGLLETWGAPPLFTRQTWIMHWGLFHTDIFSPLPLCWKWYVPRQQRLHICRLTPILALLHTHFMMALSVWSLKVKWWPHIALCFYSPCEHYSTVLLLLFFALPCLFIATRTRW